jgi:hypothetical protein
VKKNTLGLREQLTALFHRRGSTLLMWCLIGVILASPLADDHPRIGALIALVLLANVLLGATLARNKKRVTRLVIPVTFIWVFARLCEEFGTGRHFYHHLAHAAGLVLSCSVIWAMFDRIRETPQVTGNVIAESVIIYLVIAIAFSQMYWILDQNVPHAFNREIAHWDSTSFMYFSMVTITSVGYGGLLPVNPFVRLVATFESMTGIFYVALIVARLVSAYRPPAPAPVDDSNEGDPPEKL